MSDEGTRVSRRSSCTPGYSWARVGVSGLGLTIVGEADAQTQAPVSVGVLTGGETAPPTKLQLRTIGLGVSVQDRFLRSSSDGGHKATGRSPASRQ